MAPTLSAETRAGARAALKRPRGPRPRGTRPGRLRPGVAWTIPILLPVSQTEADSVKAGDQVSERNGAKLVVDAESAVFLEGAKLDFVREGLKQAFKFDNPNVEASCGCGESVSFKSDAGAAAKA